MNKTAEDILRSRLTDLLTNKRHLLDNIENVEKQLSKLKNNLTRYNKEIQELQEELGIIEAQPKPEKDKSGFYDQAVKMTEKWSLEDEHRKTIVGLIAESLSWWNENIEKLKGKP